MFYVAGNITGARAKELLCKTFLIAFIPAPQTSYLSYFVLFEGKTFSGLYLVLFSLTQPQLPSVLSPHYCVTCKENRQIECCLKA